jgi:hypothetical protein
MSIRPFPEVFRMPALRLLPDLEDALRSLPGVQAVSVVTSGSGEPTEVHVLAAPGKAAKQVVRDVQSLAMAGFGVDIDHRIVSVVQIGAQRPGELVEHAPGAARGDDARRAALLAVAVHSAGHDLTITVTLGVGGEEFLGRAEGFGTPSQRPRVAAAATLEAVAPLLGSPCDLEYAQVLPAGPHQVAVVVLTLLTPRTGPQVLTGSAVVRTGPEDAVCRAVLDALNRQLTG